MKYVSFKTKDNQASFGVVSGENIIELKSSQYATLKDYLASQEFHAGKPTQNGKKFQISEIAFLPVITNPEKIFCVGLNYENHRKETGRNEVQNPTIFTRFANSQIGHKAPFIAPKISTHIDFEGELAITIGKAGRYISKDAAFSHVAGYSCYNDGSVRDWQYHTTQFTPGKNFEGTGGFGPFLVTPDEVGALAALKLQTRLNGMVVQETRLGDMIFDIPTIIAYCSTFTKLEIGDVIVTGTPGGVGAKRTPPLWMKHGDLIEIEIDNVGLLQNTVTDEV